MTHVAWRCFCPLHLLTCFCADAFTDLSACETLDSINPFIGTYFTRHGLICLQAVHRLCDFVNDTFVCPPEYRILHLFSSITAHMCVRAHKKTRLQKMLIVIVVVGLHSYALSVSNTSHQRNLSGGREVGTFVSGICVGVPLPAWFFFGCLTFFPTVQRHVCLVSLLVVQ